MRAAPSVSLILAVYQNPRVLQMVLSSLARQTFADFEIVVADDGSGPEVAQVLSDWRSHSAHPIRHVWHPDEGFRKTVIVNRAVAESSGPYLVFADGDCILHHRFIERHALRARSWQALSGRRVMLDAQLTSRLTLDDVVRGRIEQPAIWWGHAKAHDLRNGVYLPGAFGWRGGFSNSYEILGSNFSLPREHFVRVAGYDEGIIGRGMEDVNLRARLLMAGVSVRSISQEAIQYHCHHENSGFPHDAAAVKRWSNPLHHVASTGSSDSREWRAELSLAAEKSCAV